MTPSPRPVTLLALAPPWACSRGDDGNAPPTAAVERARIERLVVATGTIEREREGAA